MTDSIGAIKAEGIREYVYDLKLNPHSAFWSRNDFIYDMLEWAMSIEDES